MCIPTPLLGNGSVNTFCGKEYKQQQKNCWPRRFLRDPYRIKGQYVGASVYPLSRGKELLEASLSMGSVSYEK
jgi:hypothetical protein